MEGIGPFLRQFNDRGVDECRTLVYQIVIHTKHPVTRICIGTPYLFGIRFKLRSRGGGVVPAFRNGFDRIFLKVFTPRQGGDGRALGGEIDRVAPFAQVVSAAVALHLGLVSGSGVQTGDGIGCRRTVDGVPCVVNHFFNGDVINIKVI